MGVVKQKYISSVYLNKLYQQVVADVTEESMKAAIERVKESPHHATSGEQHRVRLTSSYCPRFALVSQLFTFSRFPSNKGLNITEVAHGYQATIKQYVQQLGMVNSYDTWHGTKNVAKQLHRICAGTVRTRDRTWFTELSDKARCTKVHLYWCMRNCGGNPDCLRAMIVNISKHFQPGYVPQRKPLTMPAAISVYEAALRKTLIYKKRLDLRQRSNSMHPVASGTYATISVLIECFAGPCIDPTRDDQASSSRTSFSRNEMMLDSAGIYTGEEDASDQNLLVVERKTFKSLCSGLVQQLVHAFTCAGMLPRQYMNFSLFAGMGVMKQKYISSVYLNKLYQQVVADVAEESMKAAVEHVKESPHHATSGEWAITDARHDSMSNAYHSTVPCLAGSTHRIVGISTLSRQQHRVRLTSSYCPRVKHHRGSPWLPGYNKAVCTTTQDGQFLRHLAWLRSTKEASHYAGSH
ncbi:hypothetical protein EMCRGX_G022632 [Ephydatia muelleri]